MEDIRNLVERAAETLGASADPSNVEALAASLLSSERADDEDILPLVAGASIYISLTDCSSLLAGTVRARAYDKIRRVASHLESALRTAHIDGLRHIAVSPISEIAVRSSGSEFISLARIMDAVAADCGASSLSGFTATAERVVLPVASALISIMPEVLGQTQRVLVDVHAASPVEGINLDALLQTVQAIRRFDGASERLMRAGIVAGGSPLPPSGSRDAVLRITVNAGALILMAVGAAPVGSIDDLCDVLAGASFLLGRELAGRGDDAAATIRERSGLDVRFDGVDLTQNPHTFPSISSERKNGTHRTLPLPAAVEASMRSAIARGFGGALRHVHLTPVQKAAAFTSRTGSSAAAGSLADHLASALARRETLVIHPAFVDGEAGEIVSIGAFHDVVLEDPPDNSFIARGGRIPAVSFTHTT